LLILLAMLLASVVWLVRKGFPGPITNPTRYTEVLKAWQAAQPTYVGHFPPAVPPSASEVRMHFEPGALQGATSFEIRYILPAAEFQAEATRARALAAAYVRDPARSDYSYVTFCSDRESASPTRQSLTIGAPEGMDRWGITIDPARYEICYWVVDD
jgi:hypothetical protein